RRPSSALFPYTTLFRSVAAGVGGDRAAGVGIADAHVLRARLVARPPGDAHRLAADDHVEAGIVRDVVPVARPRARHAAGQHDSLDRKSTRLNSSHLGIS